MSKIEKVLEQKAGQIDKYLEKVMPHIYNESNLEFTLNRPRFKYHIQAANKAIAEPIWELLGRGGKRWRPAFMLMVIEALGKDSEQFMDFVAIPETVHSGTLMIDDIEDHGETRRGKPCIHKIYGEDVAINAGNAMYFIPLLVLLRNSNISNETKLKIYEIYAQEMINISFGQAMDIAWHKGIANADNVTEDEYLQMCAYKTGTLARMSAKLGAVLANANTETTDKIGKLAETIGIGFQIQDDLLDILAEDRKQFGKPYGNDITEGKRTLMVIHSIHNTTQEDKTRLIEILNMHTRDKAILKEAINILHKTGSIDYTKNKAKELASQAWKEAEPLFKDSEAKKQIKLFIDFMIEREF